YDASRAAVASAGPALRARDTAASTLTAQAVADGADGLARARRLTPDFDSSFISSDFSQT
ncbi:MAG: hypothetical protein WBW74_24940, partial [Xanthobacteraceae bacterium]